MALHKNVPPSEPRTGSLKALSLSSKVKERAPIVDVSRRGNETGEDIDLREVYFLIMHFLSAGPCHRTYGQFWNELLEHQLLPRRYHSWYSRSGITSGDENDDGMSFPLSYNKLVERYPHIEKDHLVKLLKQLLSGAACSSQGLIGHAPANAAAVPTLLGTGSFSLLSDDVKKGDNQVRRPPGYMRWPHMQADQVRGLGLREIGGGFSRHHRAPSVRAASYAIVKPSTVVQKMENLKRLRGHRNAVYCAIFDRLGRYVITGSDDRLVKIWSMETAYCLASCRGHEGDITDLAVSFNNALVASASNDCIIRVWRLADGLPISVLRGHTGAVTAIAFSPRLGSVYQLLSSSDDGSCRIWDARHSQFSPRIYIPKPPEPQAGKSNGPSSSSLVLQSHQIFCCSFNSSGTVFVTGSSDTLARVWNACKPNNDDPEQPNHEMDVLAGHENDVNYVQFSGCAVASKISSSDVSKEENLPKFKNTWFTHDNIVTCSRDGSAIIWVPKSRRSHGRIGRWTRAYHLKVPPPPMPPQPPRGGPRQRILPTPRGVNMIVWSLDNRFVLAAIMDCRICVWNAVDGSLVHSLTGHSESTYVLDVHPFNPRIAMSAGYDGKTIVWDIWEGVPIRIFEIGRFKLVDGKFSPDGTSIVLSDEVGQLYILSTGQGEAQNDAKYDQFFLGDYRPLIQDAHGNVLDQETQLAPYRRNMQDLLCDSGMIPYPEPYQSLYQQRRLGSLGFEWRPSSVRFAVGTDISLVDQEYQVPPIADLDILMDPLPEFLDAMDWEPEIEVHSDDNDSEYNVTEECHSAGEQGSLSSNASASIECSGGESEDQISRDDTSRKSKTKKIKAEVDFMTSSGRRVKRRNLDGEEENSLRDDLSRKSRFGKKPSMKKSSRSKASRPRRAAARNALSFFSRISGKASDGEEDVIEGNSSQSYSSEQETEAGSEETEVSSENEENRHLKGKEIVSEDLSSHQDNPKRRLVFKLPNRDTSKRELVGPSSTTPPHDIDESSKNFSSINANGEFVEREENFGSPMKYMNHVNLLEGSIKWGGAKSRSTKRPRITEPIMSVAKSLDESCPDGSYNIENVVNEKPPIEKEELSPSDYEIQKGKMVQLNEKQEKNQDEELPIPLQKKLRTPKKLKIRSSVQESRNGDGIMISEGSTSDVPNGKISRMLLNGAWDCKTISSGIQGSQEPDSRDKMFTKVYSRSKSTRSRTSVSMNGGGMEASTSNANSINQDEATEPRIHGTRRNMNLRVIHEVSEDTSSREKSSSDEDEELPQEEDRLNSRHKVGLRSTRNRRPIDFNRRDMSPEKKKQHQSTRSSWLLLATHEEGSRYIPQLGDEVVYFRQGHQDYISGSNSREIGPWTKGNIRDVEFCKVKDLEYATHPGSGEGCCKMTLQFEDPSSNVVGKTFKLTLREVTGFPDFLVERSRYDAAMKRDWRCRDKCQVWWKNEDEENGNWWDGRIVAVKPKSMDFPDSPWERYSVQYKGDPNPLPHSPWELYDPNASMVWEEPHIDDDIRTKLIRALAKLEKSGKKSEDHYGILKLRQVSQSTTFVNKFPVPLTLDVIQSRLENNYYRRFSAMKHDVEVLLQNAEAYFGRNKDFSMKMRRLSDWFTRTLSS